MAILQYEERSPHWYGSTVRSPFFHLTTRRRRDPSARRFAGLPVQPYLGVLMRRKSALGNESLLSPDPEAAPPRHTRRFYGHGPSRIVPGPSSSDRNRAADEGNSDESRRHRSVSGHSAYVIRLYERE
ncbi:Hypothetical protein NTJ_09414 [Nesidiocoris tenuis]|uniref:Uncharacterized protein n=1 Tax=Nesidiocoris tenuis TaxID=355587 RepID=A0ABN7AYY2_9HEMI|nr:Hypothetical protein NTJ_09414 [Nesidiocoris tenuis]